MVSGTGNHLDAELLANREMPVVAGDRAEERDTRFFAPRTRAVAHALQQRKDDRIVHERQARVAPENHSLRRHTEDGRQKRTQFGEPLQVAIVAAIDGSCLVV